MDCIGFKHTDQLKELLSKKTLNFFNDAPLGCHRSFVVIYKMKHNLIMNANCCVYVSNTKKIDVSVKK